MFADVFIFLSESSTRIKELEKLRAERDSTKKAAANVASGMHSWQFYDHQQGLGWIGSCVGALNNDLVHPYVRLPH